MTTRIARKTRRTIPLARGRLVLAAVLVAAIGAPAQAQNTSAAANAQGPRGGTGAADSNSAGPGKGTLASSWIDGVSARDRQQAKRLFARGNRLALDFRLTEAIALYQRALDHWQHPGIHYNLSRALNALNRPREAYEHACAAWRYGLDGLGTDDHERRHNYQDLRALAAKLRHELAELAIESETPGTEIFVDDRPLAADDDCELMLMPGPYRVVAQKPGHWTLVEPLSLHAGTVQRYRLISERPFAPWKPWAVLGTGAAVAVVGGVLTRHARGAHAALTEEVAGMCAQRCIDNAPRLRGDWWLVQLEEHLGWGALVIGSSALVTGAVLVLWNQQYHFRLQLQEASSLAVTPVIGPRRVGLAGTLSF